MCCQEIVLGREERYEANESVWSFRRVDDVVHGVRLSLSNMAGGFPFRLAGMEWKDSERLYLCGEFSCGTEQHTEIQRAILQENSGFAAKRFVKNPHKQEVREDFERFRLPWMLYVVWQKCLGNKDFRELLLQVPADVTIVEDTTGNHGATATLWGCRNRELRRRRKALEAELRARYQRLTERERKQIVNIETNRINNVGVWEGQNNIGKILMLCRRCLDGQSQPPIDYRLLREAHIHILGKELIF